MHEYKYKKNTGRGTKTCRITRMAKKNVYIVTMRNAIQYWLKKERTRVVSVALLSPAALDSALDSLVASVLLLYNCLRCRHGFLLIYVPNENSSRCGWQICSSILLFSHHWNWVCWRPVPAEPFLEHTFTEINCKRICKYLKLIFDRKAA